MENQACQWLDCFKPATVKIIAASTYVCDRHLLVNILQFGRGLDVEPCSQSNLPNNDRKVLIYTHEITAPNEKAKPRGMGARQICKQCKQPTGRPKQDPRCEKWSLCVYCDDYNRVYG